MTKTARYLTALLLAVPALLSSCSLDQERSEAPLSPISFSFHTDGYTKALQVDDKCASQLYVYAYGNGGSKRFEDVFRYRSKNLYRSDNPHYWPADGSELTFLAYNYQADNTGTDVPVLEPYTVTEQMETLAGASFANVTVPQDGKEQMDLLIARTTASSSNVQLYFAHVFSNIQIEAANANPNYKVEVVGAKITGLSQSATLTFPSVNIAAGTYLSQDIWSGRSGVQSVILKLADQVSDADPVELTTSAQSILPEEAPSADGKDITHSFMVLPQQISPAGGTTSYISVLCRIWRRTNAAAGDTEEPAWALQFPSDETKYGFARAAIPAGEWIPGKRYTYRLTFFDGAGGGAGEIDSPDDPIGPDPGIDTNPGIEGNPVVGGAISLSLTVDNWANGGNETVKL